MNPILFFKDGFDGYSRGSGEEVLGKGSGEEVLRGGPGGEIYYVKLLFLGPSGRVGEPICIF